MSRHQEDLVLPLTLAECMAACERAASSPGWRIPEGSAVSLQCTEAAPAAFGFTNPVQVSIGLTEGDASTRVTLSASNFGFGPFQSKHVKERTRRLRSLIEADDSRPKQSQPPRGGAVWTHTTVARVLTRAGLETRSGFGPA